MRDTRRNSKPTDEEHGKLEMRNMDEQKVTSTRLDQVSCKSGTKRLCLYVTVCLKT